MALSEAQRQRRMAFLVERQNVDLATHVEMEAQFSASQQAQRGVKRAREQFVAAVEVEAPAFRSLDGLCNDEEAVSQRFESLSAEAEAEAVVMYRSANIGASPLSEMPSQVNAEDVEMDLAVEQLKKTPSSEEEGKRLWAIVEAFEKKVDEQRALAATDTVAEMDKALQQLEVDERQPPANWMAKGFARSLKYMRIDAEKKEREALAVLDREFVEQEARLRQQAEEERQREAASADEFEHYNDKCPCCFDDLPKGACDAKTTLGCKHACCTSCITKYAELGGNRCPLCKQGFDSTAFGGRAASPPTHDDEPVYRSRYRHISPVDDDDDPPVFRSVSA